MITSGYGAMAAYYCGLSSLSFLHIDLKTEVVFLRVPGLLLSCAATSCSSCHATCQNVERHATCRYVRIRGWHGMHDPLKIFDHGL